MHAKIFYDCSDPKNKGWAYNIVGGGSGPIDSDDAIKAIEGTITQTEGDLATSLTDIANALPDAVNTVGIHYSEDCSPVTLALHPY